MTDPKIAAQSMGNPGNPAGLSVPAFNASLAFFLVFMGRCLNDTFAVFRYHSELLSGGIICCCLEQ